MKYALSLIALVAAVTAQTPPGCSTDFPGTFEISPVNATGVTKRDLEQMRQKRQACTNTPVATLKGGILIDQNDRQGAIVANSQFQFDDILQPDSIYTDGFSICANGSLAIGGSAIFYSCRSGSFSNLYHASQGEQCSEIFIDTQACEGGSPAQSQSISSSTSASSASSTPSTTSTSTTPATTPSSTPAATVETTPTVVAPVPVSTPATIVPPFPSGNSTTTSATATGSAPVSTSTTPAASTSPVPFVSGADILAAGSKLFVAVAGIAAFALF